MCPGIGCRYSGGAWPVVGRWWREHPRGYVDTSLLLIRPVSAADDRDANRTLPYDNVRDNVRDNLNGSTLVGFEVPKLIPVYNYIGRCFNLKMNGPATLNAADADYYLLVIEHQDNALASRSFKYKWH